LNAIFVSSYQKVGTFRVVDGQKQGGNVASYFCTPNGQVLQIVPGPVDAAVFLREARWAVETHKLALLECRDNEVRFKAFFRNVHAERLWREHRYDIRTTARPSDRPALSGQGRIHRVLAIYPLIRIEEIYKFVFEKVLDERISTAPVEELNR